MNNLKILKTSILSTALLSIVILIAMSFTMVVLPLAYYPSIAKISPYCTVPAKFSMSNVLQRL